jgi:hypothetical protein
MPKCVANIERFGRSVLFTHKRTTIYMYMGYLSVPALFLNPIDYFANKIE